MAPRHYFRAMLAVAAPALLLAATEAGAEQLAATALPGFVVGFQAGNATQSILEEVPEGETVQEWTRMVTTQWVAGAAGRLTPPQLLENIANNLAQVCPGARTSAPMVAERSGRPSAQFRADCPLLAATGKPETFFILVIAGQEDFHIKQVAFRRVPSAADTAWAERFLAGVTLD